jgi:protein-tyrosine phosphatase
VTFTWTLGPGVVEMPDGTRFRGRALRDPLPDGLTPDYGVYLLGRAPDSLAWESTWLRWPDFRLPTEPQRALDVLRAAHARAEHERVEVACGGGRGRTGTALACLAVFAGVPAQDAVDYVRAAYHPRAVETPFQKRFVRRCSTGRPPPEPDRP